MSDDVNGILPADGTPPQGCRPPKLCGQTAAKAGPPINDGGLPPCPPANGEYTLRCVRTNEGCAVTWELV